MSKSKRLFFTCPIKALYMMREFGVKFEAPTGNPLIYECGEWLEQAEDRTHGDRYSQKPFIYIPKELEPIFEHQIGDVIENAGAGKDGQYLTICCGYMSHEISPRLEIIMRSGKHFFSAEVEGE